MLKCSLLYCLKVVCYLQGFHRTELPTLMTSPKMALQSAVVSENNSFAILQIVVTDAIVLPI